MELHPTVCSFFSESCAVTADGASLGAPDCGATRSVYLKSVYACVRKDVLLPRYVGGLTTTTPATTSTTTTTTTTSPVESDTTARPKQETIMLGDPSMFDEVSSSSQERNALRGDDGGAVATTTESDLVVGFVSDVMSSYAHIKNHKEKFILFATLSVALGLTLFLSMVVWGMYRSSRLSRIKASMQRPQQQQPTSSYYASSPTSSSAAGMNPQTPEGTVDIELEVCDHEVDTAFREPAPEPKIVAPPSAASASSVRMSPMHAPYQPQVFPMQQPQPLLYGSLRRPPMPRPYPCGDPFYPAAMPGEPCQCDQHMHDVTTISASAIVNAPPPQMTPSATMPLLLPNPPPQGILRNSASRESPASSSTVQSPSMSSSTVSAAMPPPPSHLPLNNKVVRYSTIGRPRVSSPRSPVAEADDSDLADPRSLTLSRLNSSDRQLYG